MAFWKQLLTTLCLLAMATAAWVHYYPGAPETLRSWGIDWAPVVTAESPQEQEEPQPPGERAGSGVVTQPVTYATINDRLSAIGTGRARNSVVVTPFGSGRLTEVVVSSGTEVEQGNIVARLDSEAEKIARDRAQIALEDAEARLERVMALRSSNTVTAVQQSEAELAVSNARLELRDAELELDRRSIVAPIAGVVGIIPVTEGNYVTAQSEIATIDDRSRILIDFWVPERYAAQIDVGAPVNASSIARPGATFDGTISAIDNRIDPESRTLQLQASVTNPNDSLRAGMAFEVTMRFPGDEFPAVDPLAVQWGTDGAYVWAVRESFARRVPVEIVQRNTESVLVEGELTAKDAVVTEGIHNVRDGSEIILARRTDS